MGNVPMKKVTNSDPGDADHVGGNDWDDLVDFLNNVDKTGPVKLNTRLYFRSGKAELRNPADTFSYIFTGAALAADRTLNFPLLTGTDTVVTADFIQTLTNKTVNATNNTITDTSTATGDILKGNGTKFVRMGKGTALQVLRVNAGGTDLEYATAAGSGDVLLGAVNNYGDFDNSWQDNRVRIWNPANTFRYTFIAAAIAADRNLTLPLLTGNDTVVTEAFIQTLTNKTLTTPVLTTPTINGEIEAVVTKVTGDSPYTLTATNKVIRADATSGNLTLNLPTAVGIGGTTYTIKRIDTIASTNMVTIDGSGSETIDGPTTWKLLPEEFVQIQSDGTNWIVLNHSTPTTQGFYFKKNSTNDRRYVAGMTNQNIFADTSSTSPTANMLYAFPLFIGKPTKFDTITFQVATADAGDNARCGIYYDNGNMYPGALIFDTGSISTGTTGTKNTTITAGLQFFQPGLYWLAFETSATALQMDIITGASQTLGPFGLDSTYSTNQGLGYKIAHTYGALPDPYTAAATLLTAPGSVTVPYPAIGLRPI